MKSYRCERTRRAWHAAWVRSLFLLLLIAAAASPALAASFTAGPSVRVILNDRVEFKWSSDVHWRSFVEVFNTADASSALVVRVDSVDGAGFPVTGPDHLVKISVSLLQPDTNFFFRITMIDPTGVNPNPLVTETPLPPFFTGAQTIGNVFVDAGVDRARILWDANVIGIGHVDYGIASADELSVADQAQFPVKIPDLSRVPKIGKAKREQPKPPQPAAASETRPTTQPQPKSRDEAKPAIATNGEDQPTIAKDSIQVTAFTFDVYRKNYDIWSWVPKLEYRVNGPIASGSQLYVEFTQPGAGTWVKFDCRTEETQKDRWWKTECGGRAVPEEKGSTYTGPVNFAIKMRNELAGTDATLFTGRMKVAKVLSNLHGPKAANKFVYFVDHDWNLPIGSVYLTPDELKGWDRPLFHVAFWVRGDAYKFQPHLFHQGKEVGKKFLEGKEVGQASCEADIDNNTTHYVADTVPQKAKWARVRCSFPNVRGWDKSGDDYSLFGPPYLLNANPGEYEFKLLWNNRLARTIKFTVGPDGKFDNGIATANKLGSNRVIVPVQIIGAQDGTWDRAAWKTEAFYANPLTGFNVP